VDITGGPFNPFIVMFGAYVWLAAATTPAPSAVLVGMTALAGLGWLVVDHVQAELAEHHRLNDFPAHLFTMWTSGAAIAELAAHYIARARLTLAERQAMLDEARERAVRSEHLAALTTLAAGAAHELSTPLGTIAVAARELERQAERLAQTLTPVAPLRDDARLIRAEVDRCQSVLDGMSGRASDGAPSLAAPLDPEQIVDAVRTRLPHDRRNRLQVEMTALDAPTMAGAAIVQAISALIKNAFDASDTSAVVRLRLLRHGAMLRVEVQDYGTGMSADVLRRAGEPFYSTKDAGQGLGLGLFLTRALAEQAGGSLRFEVGEGTTAVLEVPVAGA
jgi:two-component system sensor histidine kinase RegB